MRMPTHSLDLNLRPVAGGQPGSSGCIGGARPDGGEPPSRPLPLKHTLLCGINGCRLRINFLVHFRRGLSKKWNCFIFKIHIFLIYTIMLAGSVDVIIVFRVQKAFLADISR